jgi:hypothetical protein
MSYNIKKVEVWAGDILNRPGTLARVLEALTNAGAQLEFLIARRASSRTSRVFLAPLKSARQKRAAVDVGLVPASGMHALRIEGPDRKGLGAEMTRAVAARGINLRGASVAAIGRRLVAYLALSSEDDATSAAAALRTALKNTRSK